MTIIGHPNEYIHNNALLRNDGPLRRNIDILRTFEFLKKDDAPLKLEKLILKKQYG